MKHGIDEKITTWNGFEKVWAGVQNFAMGGDCVPFSFDFPPLDRIVDELRKDDLVKIRPGVADKKLRVDDIRDAFRELPLEKAMKSNFGIAHFSLSQFDHPGGFLSGFEAQVLKPWKKALAANGFTWDRCYPICFVSGPGCATNYHMDFSQVLAWQIYGQKKFCGLRDPERWADRETRLNYNPKECEKPEALSDADADCFEMEPGSVLWNTLLTPHWVEAGDSVAMSINISHGGLRHRGALCPHEAELLEERAKNSDSGPLVQGRY